jgi:hypothetical protein
MRRLTLCAVLLTLNACGPIGPPKPPESPAWDFSVSISDPSGQLQAGSHVTFAGVAKDANDFGWAYFTVHTGCYALTVEHEGFHPYAPADCVPVDRHKRLSVVLERIAPPTPRLTANGKLFYQDSQAWRWKGVTAFGLQDRFCKGEDITPFLDAFKGFNILRVFLYVEWPGTGWPQASDECVHGFLAYVAQRGFYVEEVLFTGYKPTSEAQALVDHFFASFSEANLLVELVNEPGVHDKVDPAALHVPATQLLWTDGLTVAGHRGQYLTPHTARTPDFPRRTHDLKEYYDGGGPGSPSDPAFHEPAVADEPAKLEDVGTDIASWRAYFGGASLFGAGATWHSESGKYGNLPTPAERVLAAVALDAMNAFPADAPYGAYRRIVEDGQSESARTYVIGPFMVRCQQSGVSAPEPGWTSLDALGVLWRR